MMQAVPVLADYVDTVAIDDARAVLTAVRWSCTGGPAGN